MTESTKPSSAPRGRSVQCSCGRFVTSDEDQDRKAWYETLLAVGKSALTSLGVVSFIVVAAFFIGYRS